MLIAVAKDSHEIVSNNYFARTWIRAIIDGSR
jgi:hypothetical protein